MRCTSFCVAKNFKLQNLVTFFRNTGYKVKQYRKVIHVSQPQKDKQNIFIFSYGSIVTWGLKNHEEKQLLQNLKPFHSGSNNNIESDKFIYQYGNNVEMVTHDRFNTEIIVLDSNNIQLKLAISYGLAQSVQLESHEATVQKTIEQNCLYPKELAETGKISMSQKKISRRMGKIFLARSSINLNSEYLASPEYFWEHPGFEDYYIMSKKFLDIPRRVAELNQKLDVSHEPFEMLTSQLQHRHSSILEMIIILLIFVEIVITLVFKSNYWRVKLI